LLDNQPKAAAPALRLASDGPAITAPIALHLPGTGMQGTACGMPIGLDAREG
jgi:hypothetical protein